MNADLGKTVFSPEEIDDLRDRLKQHMDRNDLTWSQTALITGVPQGTLSGWVPGTYNGGKIAETHGIATKIHRFFVGLEEKEALEAVMPSAPDYVPTPSSVRMMTCLAMAHLGDMALISTAPGCGKTASVTQYSATRAQVFKVAASPTISSTRSLLRALLDAMAEREAIPTGYSLSARIRKRVTGADALIIIDEAQNLTKEALEELRAIHDATGCGVALVGDEHLVSLLRRFAQLYSRLGIRHTLPRPTKDDVTTIAAAWGITRGPELAFLQDLSRRAGGGIRTLTKTLQLAVRGARARGAPLDIADLKEAVAQRYGEVV